MTVPHLTFSHVGFFVRDLSLMEDFYQRVMGFTVTDRGDLETANGPMTIVFMSRDPKEHHQLILATGRPETPHFDVINQISFRVAGLSAIRYFYNALQSERVTDLAPVTHGNAISLYFRDPEGHRLEIFFDTPWYCAQPCREPVDFSKSDEEILAATEKLARSLPGFKPREVWSAELREKMSSAAR